MYLIEYLDALLLTAGSFKELELAEDWIQRHVAEEERPRYRVVLIPTNVWGMVEVAPAPAGLRRFHTYVGRGKTRGK